MVSQYIFLCQIIFIRNTEKEPVVQQKTKEIKKYFHWSRHYKNIRIFHEYGSRMMVCRI